METTGAALNAVRYVDDGRGIEAAPCDAVLFGVAQSFGGGVNVADFRILWHLVVEVEGHYRAGVDEDKGLVGRPTEDGEVVVICGVREGVPCLRVRDPERRGRGRAEGGGCRAQGGKITGRLLRFFFCRGLCRVRWYIGVPV